MSWIKTIGYSEAKGKLKTIYDRIKGPDNYIDNILSVHSLRPHTLTGHMNLYKNVLHHSGNSFPNWFLEALGTYVSYINKCTYCYLHHFEGMKRFLNDDATSDKIRAAVEADELAMVFDPKQLAAFHYAKELTFNAAGLNEDTINELKEFGYDDGEILEINQVVSYFNYANRTVLGLGVSTAGDILGLSPKNKDDENSWGHQ
ncbi:peroxidase-related enzyme [Leptobacterium flavescens]|uniref:Peroxidase-related enzyme n=1 Tax=Leptobacterium flavescens TaxID=472055 RepID=A0A6P0UHV9_9FLAO|nr:peroxidase-related enzyme [Leptobacterium flavescens]NER12202.1 peroxidase-related enzyme [Leptobacterium flavescens]